MDQKEIFSMVKEVFSHVISDKFTVKPETASRDVYKWDSLNHVLFITEVEKVFGIRFELADMLEMRTIGDICRGVEEKLLLK